MIIGCTGHRPHKLAYGLVSGYRNNELRVWLKKQTKAFLIETNPKSTISGMALGFDQDFLLVCVELGIPFVAAVPFEGQERLWPIDTRRSYNKLLKQAAQVVVVSRGDFSDCNRTAIHDAMRLRNAWVVDHCNKLLACWDGTDGGTANTVLYAQRVGREMHVIDPNEFRKGGS